MADVALRDAKIIGQENFELWSEGFDPDGYLDVLPHPDVVVPFYNPIEEWQNNPQGSTGDFFSSWGPDEVLEAQLSMEELEQLEIEGLGILTSADGLVPWLPRLDPDTGLPLLDENGETLPSFTPYEILRAYQGTAPDGTTSELKIPGPLIVTEPGDKVQITLTNNLTKIEEAGNTPANTASNLHTHGFHTSPLGRADNVLHLLGAGETFEYDIQVPTDQTVGLSWYHPHFHGYTNTQLAAGLVGALQVNPNFDEPDLNKWDPTSENFYLMTLNTFGLQQVDRAGSPDDPLNQSDIPLPAGTPVQTEGFTDDGLPIYELSDAVFIGYNAKPVLYNPELPLGRNEDGTNNPEIFEYGGGVLETPAENVIHTINGQYNPTLELETGELQTFSLLNADVNSHHVLQLYKEEIGADGEVTLELQEMTYIGLDGDSFPGRATEEIRRTMEDSPIFQPGQRITIDHSFTEPGKYYLLSNGTPEIVGENSPELIQTMTAKLPEGTESQGFDDGHYTWGPQVLMTFDVTGPETAPAPIPEAYDSLEERVAALIDRVNAAENGVGVDRERTYIWSANIGGAIAEGNIPDDLEVHTFEGTYRINGGYFLPGTETPIALPMLGTAEIWNVFNISGLDDERLLEDGFPNLPLLEWHPFHIHQNPFTVLDINGQRIADLDNTYLPYIEGDTIALPPTHQEGTVTETNPYGTAEFNGDASLVRMYMQFKDYDGSFVNHCHILFHEDAGMMAVVRVILNTNDTWLGLSNEEGDADGTSIELLRGSGVTGPSLNLNPFGSDFTGGVDIDIEDVNSLLPFEGNNVTDNTTDVIAMEIEGDHTVRVFDGRSLFNLQEQGIVDVDGNDTTLQIAEFNAFQGVDGIEGEKGSVATGDITGNGFADIVTGIVTEDGVLIEIYNGEDFELLTSILIDELISDEDDDLENNLNVAVGDAAGDNFEDIYITNHGKLTVLSGIDIEKKIAAGEEIDFSDVVAEGLEEGISPYGEDYTGEIEVTSGYVLQRPEPEDDNPPTEDFDLSDHAFNTNVQGNNANITTLAVDREQLAEGDEQVKIWTYTAGGHHAGHGGGDDEHGDGEHGDGEHGDGEHGDGEHGDDDMEHMDDMDDMEHMEEMEGIEMSQVEGDDDDDDDDDAEVGESDPPVELAAAFTPEGNITNLSGTFADVPGNQRGEPVLFVQNEEGTREIFQVRGGNLFAGNVIGTTGNDSIDGGDNNDNIYGLEGDDILNGNLGDDLLDGFRGIDSLNGGAGNDSFRGGKDDDILIGGEGADILNGERGDDILTGGADPDLFVFDTDEVFDANMLGIDSITDFNPVEDLIELEAVTFTAFETTEEIQQNFAVVASESDAAASEAFIVYDSTTGNLYYNVDGTAPGFGSGGQFATLEGAPGLAAENFMLG